MDTVQGRGLLLRHFRSVKADHRRRAAQEPEWSNKQINGVPEESGLVSFDRVTYELENPANDEQRQRPTPVEEEERQRDDDHRYTDAVR